MSTAPNLLNDDGTASIAICLMMSHHAFRRDLGRFEKALGMLAQGESSSVSRGQALAEEWKWFRTALHGHHESEDHGVFPSVAGHDSVKKTIEGLSADHRRIDPLLERGDAAFAELSKNARADARPAGAPHETKEALAVLHELLDLLTPHLATEEREIIPFLRPAKVFPPPPNDEGAAMYAQGFAWAMQGIATDVLDRVCEMLPESLLTRLPAARAAFDARCEKVWGPVKAGAARTPIPDP